MTSAQFWDGKDWQTYCMNLLRARYGPHDVQMVPDRHQGDLGIEAFAHADGCVFQCYAAEEPLSTKALYEAQRDKLTTDLGKLRKNKGELLAMFGTMKVKNYVFMVPRHESNQLIQHATTKSVEVLGWGLPFIENGLRITVVTDQDYTVERQLLYPAPPQLLSFDETDADSLGAWRGGHDSLVAKAREKLGVVGISGNDLTRYLDALLTQYLDGENASEALRETLPDQWASAMRCKSSAERLLTLRYPPASNGSEKAQVNTIATELAAHLQRDAPALDEMSARTIAWSTVADWLMRCPLDWGVAAS